MTTYGQTCPQLKGTFHCRGRPAFDLKIQNDLNRPAPSYTMADPSGTRSIVVDGRLRDIETSTGKGQYIARCDGRYLLIELHAPNGSIVFDRYYIDRAALVRVRTYPKGQGRAHALSCAPTHGTWRLYPH